MKENPNRKNELIDEPVDPMFSGTMYAGSPNPPFGEDESFEDAPAAFEEVTERKVYHREI